MNKKIVLEILKGPESGEIKEYKKEMITIGSLMSDDLNCDSSTGVLPNHASIRIDGDKYILLNHCFSSISVNGKNQSEAELQNNDIIQFGTIGPKFRMLIDLKSELGTKTEIENSNKVDISTINDAVLTQTKEDNIVEHADIDETDQKVQIQDVEKEKTEDNILSGVADTASICYDNLFPEEELLDDIKVDKTSETVIEDTPDVTKKLTKSEEKEHISDVKSKEKEHDDSDSYDISTDNIHKIIQSEAMDEKKKLNWILYMIKEANPDIKNNDSAKTMMAEAFIQANLDDLKNEQTSYTDNEYQIRKNNLIKILELLKQSKKIDQSPEITCKLTDKTLEVNSGGTVDKIQDASKADYNEEFNDSFTQLTDHEKGTDRVISHRTEYKDGIKYETYKTTEKKECIDDQNFEIHHYQEEITYVTDEKSECKDAGAIIDIDKIKYTDSEKPKKSYNVDEEEVENPYKDYIEEKKTDTKEKKPTKSELQSLNRSAELLAYEEFYSDFERNLVNICNSMARTLDNLLRESFGGNYYDQNYNSALKIELDNIVKSKLKSKKSSKKIPSYKNLNKIQTDSKSIMVQFVILGLIMNAFMGLFSCLGSIVGFFVPLFIASMAVNKLNSDRKNVCKIPYYSYLLGAKVVIFYNVAVIAFVIISAFFFSSMSNITTYISSLMNAIYFILLYGIIAVPIQLLISPYVSYRAMTKHNPEFI